MINRLSNTLIVLESASPDTFYRRQTLATGAGPSELQLAQLNNDGRIDAVCRNEGDASLSVYLGTPNDSLLHHGTIQLGTSAIGFATGKVDPGSDIDLVVVWPGLDQDTVQGLERPGRRRIRTGRTNGGGLRRGRITSTGRF